MDMRGRDGLSIDEAWREHQLDSVEATQAAKVRFKAYLRAGLTRTVWLGRCNSWHLDADGDPAMWPWTWQQWKEEMATPTSLTLSPGPCPGKCLRPGPRERGNSCCRRLWYSRQRGR